MRERPRETVVTAKSSVIARLSYDPDTQTLEVEFRSGRLYWYFGVPLSEFEQLKGADSMGAYFNREIRPRYEGREIRSG